MKSVRSIRNQYRGINAHLHSYFQNSGSWAGFHTRHIVHLADILKAHLLPMGYTTEVEESLQIRRVDETSGKPRADISIYDLDPHRPSSQAQPRSRAAMTFAELLDEPQLSETPYRAVQILEYDPTTMRRGQPVAWVELLSPSNKGKGEDANAYRAKRMDILVQGLVFVELDYLHQTPPSFHTLGSYPGQDGYPYRIIIIDPRPVLEDGPVQLAAFAVDEPIPMLQIPLNRGEFLSFDFSLPYRQTYEAALFGLELVDYTELPLNFERYSADDQTRIARRMLSVLEAAQNGKDLEAGSFEVNQVSLEEVLKQIEAIKQRAPE